MKTIFTIILLFCANLFGATVAEKLDDGIPVKNGSITATNGGLWIGNGTAFQLFPIGTNGQVLSVNTGATNKLEWITGGGGGGVTSIATNSGLTGGTITTTGTIGIATGGITNTMVNASAAIDGTKIDPTFVSQTITSSPTNTGQALSVKNNGSLDCVQIFVTAFGGGLINIINGSESVNISCDGDTGTVTAKIFFVSDGIAPSMPVGGSLFYSDTGEMHVIDSSGNDTPISPHAKDGPSSMYDLGRGLDELHKSTNYFVGRVLWINHDRLARKLDGEKNVGQCRMVESFGEYNARTGCNLKVQNWEDVQIAFAFKREAEIKVQKARGVKQILPSHVIQPKPAFIK